MQRIRLMSATWAIAGMLVGCSGEDTDSSGDGDSNAPVRGTIVATNFTTPASPSVTRAEIDAQTAATGIQPLSLPAKCDVDLRHVTYNTVDPAGKPATASAGVMVPTGSDAACSGARPVVLYAHGTTIVRSKNMADATKDIEAGLLMATFAAHGFIVVAPNYLGYDVSSLAYHPYLNAEAQAVDMVDALRAAKKHLSEAGTTRPASELFISG